MKTENGQRAKIERLVILSILTAIVAVLAYLGGFIKIGGLASISLTLIPVVLGAALCGPAAGAWLGSVSGAVFFATADAAFWFGLSVFGTIVTVLVKGALAGYLCGLAYRLLARFGKYTAVLVSAVVAPVVNTGVFLLGCLVFFLDTVTLGASGEGMTVFAYLILVFVGLNFVFELLVNLILSPALLRIIHIFSNKTQA